MQTDKKNTLKILKTFIKHFNNDIDILKNYKECNIDYFNNKNGFNFSKYFIKRIKRFKLYNKYSVDLSGIFFLYKMNKKVVDNDVVNGFKMKILPSLFEYNTNDSNINIIKSNIINKKLKSSSETAIYVFGIKDTNENDFTTNNQSIFNAINEYIEKNNIKDIKIGMKDYYKVNEIGLRASLRINRPSLAIGVLNHIKNKAKKRLIKKELPNYDEVETDLRKEVKGIQTNNNNRIYRVIYDQRLDINREIYSFTTNQNVEFCSNCEELLIDCECDESDIRVNICPNCGEEEENCNCRGIRG